MKNIILFIILCLCMSSCLSTKSRYRSIVIDKNSVENISGAKFRKEENVAGITAKLVAAGAGGYYGYNSNLYQKGSDLGLTTNNVVNGAIGAFTGYAFVGLVHHLLGDRDEEKITNAVEQVQWLKTYSPNYTFADKGRATDFYIVPKWRETQFLIESFRDFELYHNAFGVTDYLPGFVSLGLSKMTWEDIYQIKQKDVLKDIAVDNLMKQNLLAKLSLLQQVYILKDLRFIDPIPISTLSQKALQLSQSVEDYGTTAQNFPTVAEKAAERASALPRSALVDYIQFKQYFSASKYTQQVFSRAGENLSASSQAKLAEEFYLYGTISNKKVMMFIPRYSIGVLTARDVSFQNINFPSGIIDIPFGYGDYLALDYGITKGFYYEMDTPEPLVGKRIYYHIVRYNDSESIKAGLWEAIKVKLDMKEEINLLDNLREVFKGERRNTEQYNIRNAGLDYAVGRTVDKLENYIESIIPSWLSRSNRETIAAGISAYLEAIFMSVFKNTTYESW